MAGIGAILAGTVAAFAATGTMTAGADAVGIATVFVVVAGIAAVFGVADLPMKALDAADSTAVVASAVGTASMTEEVSTVEAVSMEVASTVEGAPKVVEVVFMVEVVSTEVVTVEATADTAKLT